MNSFSDEKDPSDQANPIGFNQVAWDELSRAGDQYYHAVTPAQVAAARNDDWKIRITPQKPVPKQWLEPISNQAVLLLAGGGGQQAPLLAAAGARVTVIDISQEQLARDQAIAARDGLRIETVVGNIADLSCFSQDQFDLIINPCSVCYCPDVKPVWQESFRVLKPGGHLITGFINPLYYLFDAVQLDQNRFVVRHKIPYSDFDLPPEERLRTLGEFRPREYGHTLSDLIGAQLSAGFLLNGFYEDGWGDNDRLSEMINVFVATRALKPNP